MAKDTKSIYPDNIDSGCRVLLKVLEDDFGLKLYNASTSMLAKANLNETVLSRFLDLLRYVRNKNETLCKYVCNRLNAWWTEFLVAPAASTHHHNYASGLIEHTTQVAEICKAACTTMRYHEGQRARLVAAALLHDLGKVYEYGIDKDGKAYRTTSLVKHIEYGYYTALEDGYKDIADMIATHHGKTEWGCLREPNNEYEWALHFADMISSQCYNRCEEAGN